ncbi:UmuD protein [Scardovia inopinata]|uniref:Peptidase S24/S26A/S26B/S26C domain-containing protein n=1 Tax=Scardovia inopinata F0304 TaxID=641146 RepID=W5IJB9_SCAIO|nr:translesion error-prone DNA polymerase V autoproteolytic subunit [Scardovia inopinata]EFG26984.1 hypothetical protein HMPREF9020_00615 [Scardovia inopinata F0304]BAR06593.1 putative SOS mutagenesis protein UmuD [Scardovia inopinata JCM 12537]SUV52111.1 UmuD protein [Scardovia inopinata]
MRIPMALEAVPAGFPSVAQDYFDGDFSFDENVITHPDTTFVVRVSGDSMEGAGIFNGDILIVDKSLAAEESDIVIAAINGELTVKRLLLNTDNLPFLHPENRAYPDIPLYLEEEVAIWGVVIGNFHWQCHRARIPETAAVRRENHA